MILKVFTKEEDGITEEALGFCADLEEEFKVEYLDLDSAEATGQAEIYQIFNSPSFVVTSDDGREITSWRGILPTSDEVKNYLRQ